MGDEYGATVPNVDPECDGAAVESVEPVREAAAAPQSARRLYGALGLSLVGGLAVLGGGAAARAPTAPLLAAASAAKKCLSEDTAVIYKYTLASSSPLEDGLWADDLFGCTYRDVTDAHGCAELGKTSCMHSLEFGLHFVHNYVTEAGETSVEAWDDEILALHQTAAKRDDYDQFMDYALTFYAPNLTATVAHIYESGADVLARKQNGNDGKLWYSFVVWSPSGKVFELTSTVVAESALPADVPFWKTDAECPESHLVGTYTADELDHVYTHTLKAGASRTPVGLPVLMPIRSNIATGDAKAVAAWYAKHMPALAFATSEAGSGADTCVWTTAAVSTYTYADVLHEVRFIENPKALTKSHTVSDFVAYIESVNRNYTSVYDITSATTTTGSGGGWTSWYDRHLGIMLETCPLDDYMTVFAESGVSFHPHGQNGTTTINTGTPKDHMWTEGTSGYGLEMQGSFAHTYSDCYEVFNWCSWDTSPAPAAAQCF